MNHINSKEIQYLFSHGLADSHKQAFMYAPSAVKPKPYIIKDPIITFDYPDVSSTIFRVNRFKTSLAQDNEIACLAQHYFSQANQGPSILVGVSRGASALINFMGLYNPINVCALVLESPFDAVESIVSKIAHETKFGCLPGAKKYGTSLVSFIFCQYKPNGIKPIDQTSAIRKDLPILLVCSLEDRLVPVWSTINLYIALRESGHDNTYLLILPEGKHARLINNQRFGSLYQQITHAFYSKFGLPHDEHLAQLGTPILAKLCQPDSKNLHQFYPHYAQHKRPHQNTVLSKNESVRNIKTLYENRTKNNTKKT